jgi:hypothetical protein
MAKPLEIRLTETERQTLEKARDCHAKSYGRERCAAILKVASGESGHQVALHGLDKQGSQTPFMSGCVAIRRQE